MKFTSRPTFRCLPFCAFALTLAASAVPLTTDGARAAAKNPPTLSFSVSASAAQIGSKTASSTMNARVHLRGDRARIETKLGGQNLVVLFAKPYVYRLLPESKAGVRYKADTPLPEMNSLASNWQQLLNQPQKIRAALKQKGAKKVGAAKLGGVQTEVYAANKWNGQTRKIKLWLRSSDSLPLRMETSASGMKVTVNWKNYRRGHVLSPSLFTVPKNYRIRDGQAPRQMPM